MTRIMVIGVSEAALIALAGIRSIKCEPAVSFSARDWDFADIQPPRRDDVFSGGCRSKGEKKRAARERRMRGGY